MQIISHRGWWEIPNEKNTICAFERSFANGYGTETDIRDLNGELVISHDMPNRGALPFQSVLDLANKYKATLALNIKSDGLALAIKSALEPYPKLNWFVFDMSIPDMRAHLANGNPSYSRLSEVEPYPSYLERAKGIWLDALESPWIDAEVIKSTLAYGKPVCLVSPELHGRDPLKLWEELREFATCEQLTLCTDWPDRAKAHIFEERQ